VRRFPLFVGVGLVGLVLVMIVMVRQGVDRVAPRGSAPVVDGRDVARLRARDLVLPVEGTEAGALRDSFDDARVGHPHEAVDILAPRGTRVLAVDDGRVAMLFRGGRGGITVYQTDPTESWCYYYAHLDGYAPGLAEGERLRKGAHLGFVGTTGNAPESTPHLHFAIFKLGPEKRCSEGTPVNPHPVFVPARP